MEIKEREVVRKEGLSFKFYILDDEDFIKKGLELFLVK